MKILYVTTIGSTMNFFKSFIRSLLDEGHTVDIVTNENEKKVPDYYREWGCKVHSISCSRSPLSKGNLIAIRQIKKVVESNCYDIVHCHTPLAAMATRIACIKARKKGTKVFYTAHGFHFYKGAPKLNWIIYYPIEKICSYYTDVLITMNQEDYALAQKKMKARKIEYVPGVGIDLQKYADIEVDKSLKRKEISVPHDATLLISVGEINENKNHETVIRALNEIKNDNIYYVIAGKGGKQGYLKELVDKLSLNNNVKFLGYRTDIIELYKCADICIFPSYREGLSVALMEAMCCSLPCAVSKIRGNTDLVDENGGVLFDPHSIEDCKNAINIILNKDIDKMGCYNAKKIKNFGIDKIIEIMKGLYNHE